VENKGMTLKIAVSDVLGNEASKTIREIDVSDCPTVQDALNHVVVRGFDAKVFTLKKPGT
jgi:hypothetical protein